MRILIVGALEGYITTAGRLAADRGARVSHVTDTGQAMADLRSGKGADLVLIDVRMPIGELVASLTNERICVPVVACGVGQNKTAAVAAIKSGAKEYLPLPPDPELIAAVIEAVANDAKDILHADPLMDKLIKLADQVAPSDASILITGESGTGKEVMARYLHEKSKRAKHPFISLNCAAIPESLMESELFGHEKGAFTGAVARRIGKFEEAEGGTLLLDEISEMDHRLQAKLLRAIQEREINRIGGNKPIKINIRIFATSNRRMKDEIAKGTFREDLYFRLNVVNIDIPPLRQRPQDIPLLAGFFIEKYAKANDMPVRRLDDKALAKLMDHSWPGNVRELENICHRAVLMSSGDTITSDAILVGSTNDNAACAKSGATLDDHAFGATNFEAVDVDSRPGGADDQAEGGAAQFLGKTLADVERDLIKATLQHCLGNRTQTAHILGISIRTLRNKLKQYAMEQEVAVGGGISDLPQKTASRVSNFR